MNKIISLVFLLALVSCKDTVVTGFQDKPVVESYLYADESPTVKVSKLIAFSSDMIFSDVDIDKLDVSITETTTQKKYTLTSSGEGVYGNKSLDRSASPRLSVSARASLLPLRGVPPRLHPRHQRNPRFNLFRFACVSASLREASSSPASVSSPNESAKIGVIRGST